MLTEEGKVPEAKPISAGQVFIGLCTLRNGSVQMLWWRAHAGIVLNTAGLVASFYLLAGEPELKVLGLLSLTAPLALYFNGYWRELLASAKKTEEYWTEELVQVEEANGIDGGCKVFFRSQFPKPGPKPKVPKVLRNIRHACMVLWVVILTIALILIFAHKEFLPCSWKHLDRFCSYWSFLSQ